MFCSYQQTLIGYLLWPVDTKNSTSELQYVKLSEEIFCGWYCLGATMRRLLREGKEWIWAFLNWSLKPEVVLEKYFTCCKGIQQTRTCLLVGCVMSQPHASVSQGRVCSDNSTCCHTEIEVADPTFYLTQSQYTDTGLTSPNTDSITPGAWQSSHWSANFWVTGMTWPRKNPGPSEIRTWDLPLLRQTPYH